MRENIQYPQNSTLLWRFLWSFLGSIILLFSRIRVDGMEHIPKTGGCVLASNHTMGPDYFFLALPAGRQIYYMAKAEAFTMHPWITKLLLNAGVFPIRRGKADTNALQGAVELTQQGHMVGMFPEGTRSHNGELQRGRSGVARIAMQADVPVIPVVVINSEAIYTGWRRLQRPVITVRFGKPQIFDGDLNDPKSVQHHTHQLMIAIAKLLPSTLQGFYRADVI